MNEQELRDYVKLWAATFKEYGGRSHYGNEDYLAQIVTVDVDIVAIRILHYTQSADEVKELWRPRETVVAYDWTIASYKFATELLRWAELGGNWKEVEEL